MDTKPTITTQNTSDASVVTTNEETNHESHENKIISNASEVTCENGSTSKTQQDLIREYYQNLQKHKYERFIEITMNQTTYTREEAIASLEKHKGDITLVIKEFLGVPDKREEREKEQNSKSLNQKRYTIIRECMDNASKNFAMKQEQAKRYNEFMQKRQQKANEDASAINNSQ